MDPRLPAHVEVAALVRSVGTDGGFGMVLSKGEREAGTILLVLVHNGTDARIYERMPEIDGSRRWRCIRRQDPGAAEEFQSYLDRRKAQDRDIWIVELDVANAERFIGVEPDKG